MPTRACFTIVLLVVAGCKSATPVAFEQLVAPSPGQLEPICRAENNGKRVVVEGHLLLPDTVNIEDGKLSLALYAQAKDGEGVGRSVTVEAKDEKHVTFKTTGEKFDWQGGRAGTQAKVEAATVHAAGGDGRPGDRFSVALDVEVLTKFNSKEISACVFRIAELKKP